MFDKNILNTYFFINIIFLLCFPIISVLFNNGSFFQEGNLYISLAMLFFVKYIRSYSPENFLIDFFFYAKMLCFCFLFSSNKMISLWFLFASFGNIFIYMLCLQVKKKFSFMAIGRLSAI